LEAQSFGGVPNFRKSVRTGKISAFRKMGKNTMSATATPLPYPAHRLALIQTKTPGRLLIHEIYRSLQGESTFAGLPCVFIRTTVCGQRCTWCDTPHAFVEGTELSVADVLRRVEELDCPLVELTGGEPLLQPETRPLMTALADAGHTVLLETGGAEDVSDVDGRVRIIMDLKCPDSGECERNRWSNLDHLKSTDEIKFVIASRQDFDWTADTIRAHRLDERFAVLLSAVFGCTSLSGTRRRAVSDKLVERLAQCRPSS
jgi:7-carboxy-7-deazaguanine synthase